ncbi:MAG TPA: SRPBCC domain-containing protein [Chitinophagaceae bacterium]|nr:SRPBCC domain-containing protein [Chitinophagaceae bacterium]
MTSHNWKQFIKRIPVRSSTQAIFKAWSTQEGLESWFLKLAEFKTPNGILRNRNEPIQKGDRYKWLWFGYDDSVAEENEIVFSNETDELQFIFSGECIVKVRVKEEAGEIICELEQTMPMEDETEQRYFFIECGKGWTFYLTNLKSILEGGPDLRNKNNEIHNVINA